MRCRPLSGSRFYSLDLLLRRKARWEPLCDLIAPPLAQRPQRPPAFRDRRSLRGPHYFLVGVGGGIHNEIAHRKCAAEPGTRPQLPADLDRPTHGSDNPLKGFGPRRMVSKFPKPLPWHVL
ncbi:hypothetical protein H8959_008780 [Pygathrix nigripes]